MDEAHDSWRWMQRLTQAASVGAFAVIVAAGLPAEGGRADPARHRAAMEAYQAGRWSDAWPALGELADAGDVDAARVASLMARQGPRLYGRPFVASPERRDAWARLAGVQVRPEAAAPTLAQAAPVAMQALAQR